MWGNKMNVAVCIRWAIETAKSRCRDECGAVTVEWVVLTSAVVALAAGVGSLLVGDGDDTVLQAIRTLLNSVMDQAAGVSGGEGSGL
jgi:hypothetical protein